MPTTIKATMIQKPPTSKYPISRSKSMVAVLMSFSELVQILRRSNLDTSYSAYGMAPEAACHVPAQETRWEHLRSVLTQARHLGVHTLQAGKLRAKRHASTP